LSQHGGHEEKRRRDEVQEGHSEGRLGKVGKPLWAREMDGKMVIELIEWCFFLLGNHSLWLLHMEYS